MDHDVHHAKVSVRHLYWGFEKESLFIEMGFKVIF